ncbi:antizyme inhibitor 2-like [Uloborus diversus]|uniref:antizyme inhibitor 2-like n=1 Tax=Uloborus diversus TaxID=327109 RepID=UPI00240933D7|nr:antizyme inhibitor 2-like [Uloborus diversus]
MGKTSYQEEGPEMTNGCGKKQDLTKLLNAKSSKKRFASAFDFMEKNAKDLGQEQVFYAVDFADVLWKVQQWKERLPNVHIYYAVKVNSDPLLLKLFTRLGLSFDCASEGEIRMVLEAGCSPQNIVFAHTIKTHKALKYAASVGVDLLTFDNKEELHKIFKFHPNARLLLRLRPKNVHCMWDLSDKFGSDISDVKDLLKTARDLGLNIVGVSFHVGALCTDPDSFVSTIRDCRTVFDIAEEFGFRFEILDLGGGFFGSKGTEESFRCLSEAIRGALRKYFPDPSVQLIAEPGCYLVASAFTLVTTIFGKRHTLKSGGDEDLIEVDYYINESIYGSFFRGIQTYDVHPKPLLEASVQLERPIYRSRVFGQTCCSEDVLREGLSLPELEIGECLVWENAGAYSRAVCSEFCGVPLPVNKYFFGIKHPELDTSWISNPEEIANVLKDSFVTENENS